jgi:site-specific DNA recombinase
LKQEYERRLDRLQQEHQVNADTAALQRHQRHLELGKSRLIDSYTEGLIDKTDFDPKITHVKLKLEQVAGQIATAQQHHAGQFELFLVINRLEEFAAAVNDRLTSLDFTAKREIVRALVKRVEIHRDEIVVVFRVDPDPGFNRKQGEPESPATTPNRQDCRRRFRPVPNVHSVASRRHAPAGPKKTFRTGRMPRPAHD